MKNLLQDIFIIPVRSNTNIVYSPLRYSAFYANQKAVDIISDFIANDGSLQKYNETIVGKYLKKLELITPVVPKENNINFENNLVVILSQLCNLACEYCYAQESRSKQTLSKKQLKSAIDFFLAQPNNGRKKISFIGGGEPTITWDLLKWTVEYAEATKNENQKIHYSITTNGTLLTDDKIEFIKTHKIHIGLSFEILPEIQNAQRKCVNPNQKSFDIIDNAIQKLSANKISYSFRSTITNKNVKLMKDMVVFVSETYPQIKRLHFEQVTDIKDNTDVFYKDFVANFFEARKTGKDVGIEVYNSITNSVNSIRRRFCRGEFCITPTGNIVSCHRVSSNREKSFNSFNYGTIETTLCIDKNMLENVLNISKQKKTECENCFAKWHCAGGCMAEKFLLSKEQQTAKCNFVREIITKVLEEKLTT
jgi:radical SAM protein with 4Fe4S-binding SPASM domain